MSTAVPRFDRPAFPGAGVSRFVALLITCVLASVSTSAAAQTWPQRKITAVSPFPAGGITDALTRIMAEELAVELGVAVVAENKSGAGGTTGMACVLAQPADGYTIGMGGAGASAIVPALNKAVRYTPSEFEPIGYVAALPSVLVIHPSVPASNLKEFIAYAKQKGGEITCASHGLGSFNHLACMQFNEATGTQMTHVPYKGASQVNLDLLPGRVLAYFAVLPTVLSHIQNGQLKALATGDEVRLKPLPQVPTLREAGVPGITISQWNALFVRAGTPEPILTRLREATARILKKPDVIAKIDATGSVMRDMTAAELGRMTASEYSLYQTLSQRYNIRME